MGVSVRDCNMIAAQIGAEFFIKKESGKSRRYHVVIDGGRSDFMRLNEAYEFMSGKSLMKMYDIKEDSDNGIGEADLAILRKAQGILARWTESMVEDESVPEVLLRTAVDATGLLYDLTDGYEEMLEQSGTSEFAPPQDAL